MVYRYLWMCLLFISCDNFEDFPERIDKLRAIGVRSEPPAQSPSASDNIKTTTLTFYVISSNETTVRFELIEDSLILGSPFTIPLTLVGNPVEESYSAFKVTTQTATAVIPTDEVINFREAESFLSLRYGIRALSGDEVENIVGNIVIYPEGTEALDWQNPTLLIDSPTLESALGDGGETTLKASFSARSDEEYKISWFVSSGEIVNRRALETKWKEYDRENQSIVVTARGKRTGSFGITIGNVGN